MKTKVLVRWPLVVLTALLWCSASATATAQGASLVPANDPVYRDIDRLAELGVLDRVIIGQRPYSAREIARIASVARARLNKVAKRPTLGRGEGALADDVLERIEQRFAPRAEQDASLQLVPLDQAAFVAQNTDTYRRGFPGNEAKATEATIDPLADRRLGRPAIAGSVQALELSHRADVGDILSLQLEERFEARQPRDTTITRGTAAILRGFVRVRAGNAALTLGRQQFTWAQRDGTGLFLASDAPALDQISIASDEPFLFPSVFRAMGPAKATLILADLGPSVARDHSKLLAYKVSVSPSNSVEFGGTFFDHFGGAGHQPSSAIDQLIDFLPFVDVFRRHNYTDTTRALDVDSDKVLGIDGHVRLSAVGGMLLSGELLIDDFDIHRLTKLTSGYGSSTFSVLFPVVGSEALSVELVAKHMGAITYTHGALSNGISTRGRFLGDELGPDSKSFSANLRYHPIAAIELSVEARSAVYSDADYRTFYSDPPANVHFVFEKFAERSNELRDIGIARLTLRTDEGIALELRGGAERIRNLFFTGGTRHDYMAEAALRFYR